MCVRDVKPTPGAAPQSPICGRNERFDATRCLAARFVARKPYRAPGAHPLTS